MIARAKSLISFRRNSQEKAAARYKLESSNSMQHMVNSILMAELRSAYTEIEDRYIRLHRSRVSLNTGGADYSWLISTKFANAKVPNSERVELERLCENVKPEECNTIITYFRKRLERCQRGSDVVTIFRNTVQEAIKSRPKPVEPGTWLAGRIRRSNTNRIDNLVDACNAETTVSTLVTAGNGDEDKMSMKNMMELV